MIIGDPRDWRALAHGDALQQQAFTVLERYAVFARLSEFDPAHVSTIGNGLATETSDIDVVCSFRNKEHFETVVRGAFSSAPGFSLRTFVVRGEASIVASFRDALEVEIYASETPTDQQLGYRHYVVTSKLLVLVGEELVHAVKARKRRGEKTEPALAEILGLDGDPYLALLDLEQLSESAMCELARRAGFSCVTTVVS